MEESRRGTPESVQFKFRFSPLLLSLSVFGLLLAALAVGLFSWQFSDFLRHGDLSSAYSWIKYILIYLVSGLLVVFISAMLIRSRYVITEKELILQFGLIKQKFLLSRVASVHLFKGSNKLAVYFDDFKTNYVIIVVKDEWYADFIRELTARNERIAFSFSTAEEEEEIKRKKK